MTSSVRGKARALCGEIDAVALRVGDGPAPVSGALSALLGLLAGDQTADSPLAASLAALRAFGDKATAP